MALDFPNPPLTVGQLYAAPNNVTYQWDGTVWLPGEGEPGPQGPPGPTGSQGPQGAPGAPGATGPGVAAGGTTGQQLQKTSATDYATAWVTPPTSLPPSGTAGGSLAGTYPSPTLAASGVTAGTYGSAAKIPRVTLTAEGRVSAVTELDVAPTGGSPSGPAGGSLAGTYPNPTLTTTGVTAGTSGDQYNVAKVTVNAEGRITGVVQVLIRARWG